MKIAIIGGPRPFGPGTFYNAGRVAWYMAEELKQMGHHIVFFAVKGSNLPDFKHIAFSKAWADKHDQYILAVEKYEKDNAMNFDFVHSYQFGPVDWEGWYARHNFCYEGFAVTNKTRGNHLSASRWHNNVGRGPGQGTIRPYGLPNNDWSDEHKDYLVWIGRISARKGTDNAIKIAKKAGKRIVLMGFPSSYPFFVEKIFPQIDQKNVIWMRAVNDEIKHRVFKYASAFINPPWDKYSEMFGIVNIEALARGVPIIAWNNTFGDNGKRQTAIGYKGGDIIDHGKHGFIIEHNGYDESERTRIINESVRLIKEELPSISRAECRERFKERFTARMMAEKTLKYYKLIIQRKKVFNITEEL